MGDAGIGKSSLLQWLATHVGESASLVSCRGGEIAQPMTTVTEIFATLGIPQPDAGHGGEVDVLNTADVLRCALEEKVAYVPGENFYPNGDGGFSAMRLNFSFSPPDVIVEGIRRLGNALKKALS